MFNNDNHKLYINFCLCTGVTYTSPVEPGNLHASVSFKFWLSFFSLQHFVYASIVLTCYSIRCLNGMFFLRFFFFYFKNSSCYVVWSWLLDRYLYFGVVIEVTFIKFYYSVMSAVHFEVKKYCRFLTAVSGVGTQ